MNKRNFEVGDKVRIIRSKVLGREGQIAHITHIGKSCPVCGNVFPEIYCALDLEGIVIPGLTTCGKECPPAYLPKDLAPVYDGYDKIDWASMAGLWQPKGVIA